MFSAVEDFPEDPTAVVEEDPTVGEEEDPPVDVEVEDPSLAGARFIAAAAVGGGDAVTSSFALSFVDSSTACCTRLCDCWYA